MNAINAKRLSEARLFALQGRYRSAIIKMDEILNNGETQDKEVIKLIMEELSSYYEQLEQIEGLTEEEQMERTTLRATIHNNSK